MGKAEFRSENGLICDLKTAGLGRAAGVWKIGLRRGKAKNVGFEVGIWGGTSRGNPPPKFHIAGYY